MIFVITVSQWSFIWLRVIKYLLLPVAYPALQPSSQTRLGYVSCKHVCICTRGDSSPSSVPVFHLVLFAFNSFNLPPGTCAIFLSPLLSLSLFSRVFFKPTPLKLLFWVQTARSVSISRSRLCPHPRLLPFFFFFWSNRRKKIRLTWLITGFWSRTVFSTWEKWR